ncbi:uncharacterized protein [Cherax quadricarinatus]|uniref:uncharacterized protein n=1 Tax=Cherax quadricarinatus TaxID=27406 RepID=UPI00387E757C
MVIEGPLHHFIYPVDKRFELELDFGEEPPTSEEIDGLIQYLSTSLDSLTHTAQDWQPQSIEETFSKCLESYLNIDCTPQEGDERDRIPQEVDEGDCTPKEGVEGDCTPQKGVERDCTFQEVDEGGFTPHQGDDSTLQEGVGDSTPHEGNEIDFTSQKGDSTPHEGDEIDCTPQEGEGDCTPQEGDGDCTPQEGDEIVSTPQERDDEDSASQEGAEGNSTHHEGDDSTLQKGLEGDFSPQEGDSSYTSSPIASTELRCKVRELDSGGYKMVLEGSLHHFIHPEDQCFDVELDFGEVLPTSEQIDDLIRYLSTSLESLTHTAQDWEPQSIGERLSESLDSYFYGESTFQEGGVERECPPQEGVERECPPQEGVERECPPQEGIEGD